MFPDLCLYYVHVYVLASLRAYTGVKLSVSTTLLHFALQCPSLLSPGGGVLGRIHVPRSSKPHAPYLQAPSVRHGSMVLAMPGFHGP